MLKQTPIQSTHSEIKDFCPFQTQNETKSLSDAVTHIARNMGIMIWQI